MDPQAAWQQMLDAYATEDWDAVEEYACSLLDWLTSGGFPPVTCGRDDLGKLWNDVIAKLACVFARNQARPFLTKRR